MSDTDDPGRDEALARRLEDHLDALGRNAMPPRPDADLDGLRPVVERLHGLREYLTRTEPLAVDDPLGDTRSHRAAEGTGPETAAPRVGKYEVVRRLGEGGQGSALLAFDPDLRRHVVLKCYHAARTPAEQEMVLKEGQALARVRSPYVAQCFSAERGEGGPFLVVEYVPGKSLRKAQRSRPLDPDAAVRLVGQLAEGLAAVHACGLLHRDLKPANVVVGDDGLPRLVDFGLAAPLAGADLRRVSGTLPYMAPEQARGECERIDARTDVYGLGAVLYELLTGRPPHAGADPDALWRAVRDGNVVPVSRLNPQVPAAAAGLCMRCLASDPAGRFASAAELAAAARRCRRRPRPALRLLAGLGVAAALLLTLLAWRPWRPPPGGEQPLAAPAGEDLTVTVVAVGGRRAPDGRLLLTKGQDVAFRVTPSRAAYLALWCVDDGGVVTQLFPNKWETDHLVPAGATRTVPGSRGYAIRATTVSTGPEKLIVFASTRHWEPPAPARHRGVGPEGGYVGFVTPEERREFDDLLRGLELVAQAPAPGKAPARSARVIVPYLVRPAD